MYYLDCRFRSGGRDSAVLIRRDGVPYARRAERALWSTAESLLLCSFLMPVKEGQNARPLASACDQDTVLGYRDPIAVIPVQRFRNDHNVLLQGVGSIIHCVAKCI